MQGTLLEMSTLHTQHIPADTLASMTSRNPNTMIALVMDTLEIPGNITRSAMSHMAMVDVVTFQIDWGAMYVLAVDWDSDGE